MKHKKKILTTILIFFVLISSLHISETRAFASAPLPAFSSAKYLSTYTYASSGKVYAYTSASLLTKTGGYIDCPTDECRIISISGNAVQVSYPVSGGRKTAWFEREKFTYRDLAGEAAKMKFVSDRKITTYKWKNRGDTFGYVASGDVCYLLRGDSASDWLQIIYPTGSTFKMAWVKGSDAKTVIWPETKPATVAVTGIKLNKSSASVSVGKTVTLTVTISPGNATNKSVTWSSSNTKVATVSGGKVKGVSTGTATITVKSNNGKAATCEITVNKNGKEIVSQEEIKKAANKFNIKEGSNAYKALLKINTKYTSNSDVYKNRSGLLVFMFEGAGNSSKTSQHRNAMCVVVSNGTIKYINRNCTTIPDNPFNSYSHPTLVSGIYRIKAWNHHPSGAKSDYAAFKVYSMSSGAPKLLRFNNSKKKTFDFKKNITSINIHGRWSYKLTGESLGCQLIGAPAFGSNNKPTEYLAFCKATGIINSSAKTMTHKTHYTNYKSGIYILDRSYGQQYLKNIGYPANALPYLK